MFKSHIKNFKRNLLNVPGMRTSKKIVVFESDDWGGIRMPSRQVYEKLLSEGYSPDADPYLKFDTLSSAIDCEALFEKLNSVRDKNNNPAIITANAVMGNPDFEKILKKDFKSYFWEPFTRTWEKYPHCEGTNIAWEYGQKERFLKFQCHGREHLNVDQWISGLQKNDKLLHEAFKNHMISISSQPSKLRFNYMEGLDFFNENEKENKKKIIEEALLYFKSYFGFESESFIANCYIWDDNIERILAEKGVKYIQGISKQKKTSILGNEHRHIYKRHYQGESNKLGQYYLVRNAFFEPSIDATVDWVSDCLNRIDIAFRWGKPAIIGVHRLNFIGSIFEANRTTNLNNFEVLLKKIVKAWPEVEFHSSDQVINSIQDN